MSILRAVRCTCVLLALVAVSACEHPLAIVGQGDIFSASGDRDCTLEAFQASDPVCSENTVTGAYHETYTAAPRDGWQFTGWGPYCRGQGYQPPSCSFDISEELFEQYGHLEYPPLTAYFRRKITGGYDAMLMGHSFFQPFADKLPEYASLAGFPDHQQLFVEAGGAGGAPISLWDIERFEELKEQNANIKERLDAGGVSLLGTTYFPLGEQNMQVQENLDGYINWVEYARVHNPTVVVFIGLPWPPEPGNQTLAAYEAYYKLHHRKYIHHFIAELRERFPDNQFYCIPYGGGAIELYRAHEEGTLPENIGWRDIFRDDAGHAGDALVELGSLIWARAIYGVEIDELEYDSDYREYLIPIANLVMDQHDHHYDAR